MNNNWDQFQSTPKLLPPTVFERTAIGSNSTTTNSQLQHSTDENETIYNSSNQSALHHSIPQFSLLSNELEKMKQEIRKVHMENENLRMKNKDFVEQAKLYSDASGHRQISITALEDIILKQTREIQQLKSELVIQQESNIEKLKASESEWAQKHNDVVVKLNDANQERKKLSEDYEKSMAKLRDEFEITSRKQEEKIESLINENRKLSDNYDREVAHFKKTIEELKLNQVKEDGAKAEQIRLLKSENVNALAELQNLKNYVNNSMPTIETVKEMNKEKADLNAEIERMKLKNDGLIKENSSIQIRLKSMNEIMTIQENQLESTKTQSSSGIYNEKKRQGLLCKWRNKVYQLLIQLKSLEISTKQDKGLLEKTFQDYLERLDESANKNKIYENIIEDKKAELSVVNADKTILIDQVSVLKETNAELEKKHKMDLQSSLELQNFVNSLMKQYQVIEESFRLANKKLIHLDKRVEFAKDRLSVVRALYSGKEAKQEQKRANVLDMTTNLSSIHGSMDPNESHFNPPISLEQQQQQFEMEELAKAKMDPDEEKILRRELELVMEERNLLAAKVQNDIELMDEKEAKLKLEYEQKLSILNDQIKELHELNGTKQVKLEEINEQLVMKTNLCENLSKKYEECHKELLELKKQISLEYEKELKKKDLEFADKLTKMDDKLNEARREQAKAVVVMRQMERSTNREKDRMENLLKSCDTYYKEHLDKLQRKVVSLEKERNILMNTLRQQGNISSQDYESLRNNLEESIELKESFSTRKFLGTSLSLDVNKSVSLKNETTEVTSFWLDSKLENNAENPEEEDDYVDTKNNTASGESDELDESDMNKNSEILQQIRKIMGNLELSDIEDDSEEKNDRKNNETQKSQSVNDTDNFSYDKEYVIDHESI